MVRLPLVLLVALVLLVLPAPSAAQLCGNGVLDPGEPCDASAPPPADVCPNAGNGLEECLGCACACPGQFAFEADPITRWLDWGTAGTLHDILVPEGTTLTWNAAGCENPTKPCGLCSVAGPVLHPAADAGTLHNQRCTNNTAIRCSTDTDCPAKCIGGPNDGLGCVDDTDCPGGGVCEPAGTCAFYLGGPTPVENGTGYSMCLLQAFTGPLAGTVEVETGATALVLPLEQYLYSGWPNLCPACDEADTGTNLNDGIQAGTCTEGARTGLPCDANVVFPISPAGYPFGSLDCPPDAGNLLDTFPVTLESKTVVRRRTLTSTSLACRAYGYTSLQCFCDTCADLAAAPCGVNVDCVDIVPLAPTGATIDTPGDLLDTACPGAPHECLDDDPNEPDAEWLVARDKSVDTGVTVTLPVPAFAPSGLQRVWVRARKQPDHDEQHRRHAVRRHLGRGRAGQRGRLGGGGGPCWRIRGERRWAAVRGFRGGRVGRERCHPLRRCALRPRDRLWRASLRPGESERRRPLHRSRVERRRVRRRGILRASRPGDHPERVRRCGLHVNLRGRRRV